MKTSNKFKLIDENTYVAISDSFEVSTPEDYLSKVGELEDPFNKSDGLLVSDGRVIGYHKDQQFYVDTEF